MQTGTTHPQTPVTTGTSTVYVLSNTNSTLDVADPSSTYTVASSDIIDASIYVTTLVQLHSGLTTDAFYHSYSTHDTSSHYGDAETFTPHRQLRQTVTVRTGPAGVVPAPNDGPSGADLRFRDVRLPSNGGE